MTTLMYVTALDHPSTYWQPRFQNRSSKWSLDNPNDNPFDNPNMGTKAACRTAISLLPQQKNSFARLYSLSPILPETAVSILSKMAGSILWACSLSSYSITFEILFL